MSYRIRLTRHLLLKLGVGGNGTNLDTITCGFNNNVKKGQGLRMP